MGRDKGADQLCSYCTADLRLCFRLCMLFVFQDCLADNLSEIVRCTQSQCSIRDNGHAFYRFSSMRGIECHLAMELSSSVYWSKADKVTGKIRN